MLKLKFTTPDGEYPGAYYRDYFEADGYRRALDADNVGASIYAAEVLAQTYIGPDVDGVGVVWEIDG